MERSVSASNVHMKVKLLRDEAWGGSNLETAVSVRLEAGELMSVVLDPKAVVFGI